MAQASPTCSGTSASPVRRCGGPVDSSERHASVRLWRSPGVSRCVTGVSSRGGARWPFASSAEELAEGEPSLLARRAGLCPWRALLPGLVLLGACQ